MLMLHVIIAIKASSFAADATLLRYVDVETMKFDTPRRHTPILSLIITPPRRYITHTTPIADVFFQLLIFMPFFFFMLLCRYCCRCHTTIFDAMLLSSLRRNTYITLARCYFICHAFAAHMEWRCACVL